MPPTLPGGANRLKSPIAALAPNRARRAAPPRRNLPCARVRSRPQAYVGAGCGCLTTGVIHDKPGILFVGLAAGCGAACEGSSHYGKGQFTHRQSASVADPEAARKLIAAGMWVMPAAA